MSIRTRLSATLAAAFVASASILVGPANASVIDFTFTGVNGTAITNGVITTDASNIAISVTGDVTDPDAFAGTQAITALIAPGTSGYSNWNWDGVVTPGPFYFSATQSSGILFLFDGIVGNLYFQPNDLTYYLSVSNPGGLFNPGDPGTFDASVVSSVAPTPLPATWTMLLAGFIGLGIFAYRGMRKSTTAAI
jgi:hypothetical protein